METEDPNRGAEPSGGGSRRRKPQAEDWLLAQPETVEHALPPGAESPPSTEQRLDSLERALKELEARRKPAEATTRAAITRAATAEAKATDALGRLDSIRAELASIHDEIANREEIARQEGSALQDVVAKLAASFAAPPESTASTVPPAPARRAGNGANDFPLVASEVERKLIAIEGRVKAADATVRSLLEADPDRTPAPAPGAEPEREREPGREREPEPGGSKIDVNRIGFEQLRELGLSVTQAARLLARRDARGQFSSLDQLDDLLDVPRELIERLKRSLRLG